MITAPSYQDKNVGVFGLARTGVTAVKSLTASGAHVYAWDDNDERRQTVKAALHNLYDADFTKLDALLLAPGVPLTHPEPHALVKKASEHNTKLISDIDVFEAARPTLPKHKVVGITGTNGKSTTTTLIGHIIQSGGRDVSIGGNIGTGVLALSALGEGGSYVFELSSFQLDLTKEFSADVAVLLNVSPDHLDRHGNFQNYCLAKKRLFDLQKNKASVAVIGVDDDFGRQLANSLEQSVLPVSVKQELDTGVYVLDGVLFDALEETPREIGSLQNAKCLQGEHNWQNAAAAYAVARSLGIPRDEIYKAMLSFPGLVHRQELVAEIDGVRFVNDSKATNSDAAMRALSSFQNIHWIAGGRAKEDSFAHMQAAAANVKQAYFYGEAAPQLQHDLAEGVDCIVGEELRTVFDQALLNAEAGDVILLSPACTAFDQYSDFERRGEAFRELVLREKGDVK